MGKSMTGWDWCCARNRAACLKLPPLTSGRDGSFTTAPSSVSLLGISPGAVSWTPGENPLFSLTSAGQAVTKKVLREASEDISFALGSYTATASVTVRDSDPDNFGDFAGDGLEDDWQELYFGERSDLALPDLDPDADGFSNRFEYLARLDPLDAASTFHVRISKENAQSPSIAITFGPVAPDVQYTVKHKLRLEDAEYLPIVPQSVVNNADSRTISHLPLSPAAFYIVELHAAEME